MSLSPFAALEQRVTRTVFARLANVEATVGGGDPVPGIFDDVGATASVGVSGMVVTQPTVTVPTDQIPADPYGAAVSLRGRNFTVAEVEHDGTGGTRLMLEEA